MPNEEYSTLEDLVFSRSFRNWVLDNDACDAAFWADFAARNPDKAELVNHAKAVIYALQLNLRPLPAEMVDAELTRVLGKLKDGRPNPVREIPIRPGLLNRRPSRLWAIAAIIAAVSILSWCFYIFTHPSHK